jgi:hypothetical protein
VLDATEAGSRVGVVQRLFDGEPRSGLLGRYSVRETGDIDTQDSPILGFTVYRAANDRFQIERAVVPEPPLVSAAFG